MCHSRHMEEHSSQSRIISDNADITSLRNVSECTSSSLTLGFALSGIMERPTTTLHSGFYSICIALGWMRWYTRGSRVCDVSLLKFAMEKNLCQALDRRVTPEKIVAEMLSWKKNWFTVSSGIVRIQQDSLNEERRKEAVGKRGADT